MIVTCPECSARYRVRDEKVKGRGARISCPKCAHKFVVHREPEPAVVGADARGVPVTFARAGQPIRHEVPDEDDEADVPTTVMPHGSQVVQQLRSAAEAAQAARSSVDRQSQYDAAVSRNVGRGAPSPVDEDGEDDVRSLRKAGRASARSEGAGRTLLVAGVALAVLIVAAVVGFGAM